MSRHLLMCCFRWKLWPSVLPPTRATWWVILPQRCLHAKRLQCRHNNHPFQTQCYGWYLKWPPKVSSTWKVTELWVHNIKSVEESIAWYAVRSLVASGHWGHDLENQTLVPRSSLPFCLCFRAAVGWAAVLPQALPHACLPCSQQTLNWTTGSCEWNKPLIL